MMSKNKSFSLLNQREIDTLVKFLTESKNTVNSDVMSQNSIDKLIRLFQTDKDRLSLSSFLSFQDSQAIVLKNLPFRNDISELCELRCSINDDTHFAELSIYNTVTEEIHNLTPNTFDEGSTADWGLSIPPSYFSQIAHCLSLKYTQATYDFVCSTFAKHNFGSENHIIPEIYLPENQVLLESIM
jgi:hypothetical protein